MAKMLREKCPRHQTQRADVAERADVKQRAATQTINEP